MTTEDSIARKQCSGESANAPLPPIEMTLPFAPTAEESQSWTRADEAGGADAALRRALELFQAKESDEAMEALQRADERGSVEAAYVRGLLYLQADERSSARDALRRADERGSMWAPLLLGQMAEQEGDATTAGQEWTIALGRAEAADAAGSADAAYVVAVVAGQRGDLPGCTAAARRADQRGAAVGSLLVAQLAGARGDTEEARDAAQRANNRGLPAAQLVLGDLFQLRRQGRRARRAWRKAATAAIERGDVITWQAAIARLNPGIRARLKDRRVTLIALTVICLALVVAHQWRWLAVVAGCMLLATVAAARPEPGTEIRTSDDDVRLQGLSSVSAGGLIVAGGVVDTAEVAPTGPAPELRPVSTRDQVFFNILLTLVAVIPVACVAWAANVLSAETALRLFYLYLGVLFLWNTLWRAPDKLLQSRVPESQLGGALGIRAFLRIPIAPPFLAVNVSFGFTEPRIAEILEIIRQGSPKDTRLTGFLKAIRRWMQWSTLIIFGAFFAAKALGPEQWAVANGLGVIASASAGITVLGIGALMALERMLRSILRLAWASFLAAVGYLLVVSLVIVAAHWLGLLEAWVTLWRQLFE